MDREKRKLAVEVMDIGAMGFIMQDKLHRTLHTYSDGLTSKETAFLQRRLKELGEWNQKLVVLNARLRSK